MSKVTSEDNKVTQTTFDEQNDFIQACKGGEIMETEETILQDTFNEEGIEVLVEEGEVENVCNEN